LTIFILHNSISIDMSIIRPGSAPTPRPVPAVGITGVLKAIGSEPTQPEPVKSPPGIGMTGALKAIGAQNSPEETRPK
jgi:hypothetical protein